MAGKRQQPPPAAPPTTAGDYMSYSRMDSLLTCGHKFWLQRIVQVPERKHWAAIGGTAFHATVEKILKSENLFRELMQDDTSNG